MGVMDDWMAGADAEFSRIVGEAKQLRKRKARRVVGKRKEAESKPKRPRKPRASRAVKEKADADESLALLVPADSLDMDLLSDVMWVYRHLSEEVSDAELDALGNAKSLYRWATASERNRSKFFEVLLPRAWSDIQKLRSKEEEQLEEKRYLERAEEIHAVLAKWELQPDEREQGIVAAVAESLQGREGAPSPETD